MIVSASEFTGIKPSEAVACMGDNGAVLAGYTKEVIVSDASGSIDMHLLIQPEADLDEQIKAWDCDECEFVILNAWLFEFDEVEA